MPRPRKPYRQRVRVDDTTVTVYERRGFKPLWIDVTVDGERRRVSLGHSNREAAREQARELAEAIARRQEAEWSPHLTLSRALEVYFREKGPRLSEKWRNLNLTRAALFRTAWGEDLVVEAIDQPLVDRYVGLRTTGELAPPGGRQKGVTPGTIEAEFRWLKSVFNWWKKKRRSDGRRFLTANPLEGLVWPRPRNVHRPIASHDRYLRTLAVADQVDPFGRLRCALVLARTTGRREGAICGLLASDLLLDEAAVRRALASQGMDERLAEHFPNGGIQWRAATDKQGVRSIVPISEDAERELRRYLERAPRLGDVPLFPAPRDPNRTIRIDTMGRWLVRAEVIAGLPKLQQGRWHPYRRLWATERKHVPVQDVAAAGGWNSIETVRLVYQQADPAGVLRAVQGG